VILHAKQVLQPRASLALQPARMASVQGQARGPCPYLTATSTSTSLQAYGTTVFDRLTVSCNALRRRLPLSTATI